MSYKHRRQDARRENERFAFFELEELAAIAKETGSETLTSHIEHANRDQSREERGIWHFENARRNVSKRRGHLRVEDNPAREMHKQTQNKHKHINLALSNQ
jgi:hypothetical protein